MHEKSAVENDWKSCVSSACRRDGQSWSAAESDMTVLRGQREAGLTIETFQSATVLQWASIEGIEWARCFIASHDPLVVHPAAYNPSASMWIYVKNWSGPGELMTRPDHVVLGVSGALAGVYYARRKSIDVREAARFVYVSLHFFDK